MHKLNPQASAMKHRYRRYHAKRIAARKLIRKHKLGKKVDEKQLKKARLILRKVPRTSKDTKAMYEKLKEAKRQLKKKNLAKRKATTNVDEASKAK